MPARQNAAAFNQPLSFDTSVVTDMSFMFNVRFRLRVLPTLPSWATRTPRALLIRPSLCLPSPLCHTHFSLHAGCLLWTRQNADAFNQLLSFNTSSVTNMGAMFRVRFRLRVLPTALPSWATRARRARS